MTYLPTLHSYLHNSSLLIQAYPTSRITTKYSLPRKSKPTKTTKTTASTTDASQTQSQTSKEKPQPTATLTLKTFHPESGICLKYRTDKAAEVGRLMAGLGRLAKGEIIEMPTASESGGTGLNTGLVDADEGPVKIEEKVETGTATPTQAQTTAGTGGGKNKKKKGGKK